MLRLLTTARAAAQHLVGTSPLLSRCREHYLQMPWVKATGIVRDYVCELYYPIHEVPWTRRVRITPFLLGIEYLVYRVDALAERNTTVDLETSGGRDREKIWWYKKLFERLIRLVGGWNEEVARQIGAGEEFIRIENAITSRGGATHDQLLTLAELRPTDVRLLHALIAGLQGCEVDRDIHDLLWPVEVLADIGNDLNHYAQDVAEGTTNVYAAFLQLHGEAGQDLLRAEIQRYTALYEQRLRHLPPHRRARVDRLCRHRFADALQPLPSPITAPPTPAGPAPAPPLRCALLVAVIVAALGWRIAHRAGA